MKLKIGFDITDLQNAAQNTAAMSLIITTNNNTIEILKSDGTELTSIQQTAVKTWLGNNFIRVV